MGGGIFKGGRDCGNGTRVGWKARRWERATKEREEKKRRIPNQMRPIPTHEVTNHVIYA